jgi:hypothetical protein
MLRYEHHIHYQIFGVVLFGCTPCKKQKRCKLSLKVATGKAVKSSTIHDSNPKRQRQQLDSKIDAMKRKLAKQTHGGAT